MLLAYARIGDYTNLIKYANKILPIVRECGNSHEEGRISMVLTTSYLRQSKYVEAKVHREKALLISTEIGDKNGEASCYENLGEVHQSVGEYEKAKEYHMKALAIRKEIGCRNGEASCYGNLGIVFQSVGEYEKAKEYHERALAMKKEIGDRDGEATEYGNLGTLFKSVGQYRKAKEYLEKALMIEKEMGARDGEACCYVNLGIVLTSLGEYEKAKEYLEVALEIKKEIGDREGEASCYGNLGNVFKSVGEYVKAKEYYEKAITFRRKIGDRKGEGTACISLGAVFLSLGKYAKANEYLQKALALSKEIGDKQGEAAVYINLGTLFQLIGNYEKNREYLEKSLVISKEIGDRNGEALTYANLGTLFQHFGEYEEAEEYYKRALAIIEEIGDVKKQSTSLCNLGLVMLQAGKGQEALSYLLPSILKCEDLRVSLRDNDQFKISFSHEHADPYRLLIALFCTAGNPNKALYVSELRRARALADLMSAKYSLENQISANPQSWVGVESVMNKEVSCTCLYFSYIENDILLWILKARKVVQFKRVNGEEMIVHEGLIGNLDEFFTKERFRSFEILADEHCEDRTLNDIQPKPCEEDIRKASRIGNDVKDNQEGLKRNLSLCHKLIIAPVVDLIEGPEIIIVPERSLYNIPFAALPDENGKYLSETFRMRVVPSLTTLKLIQDSPADYHSQTGALIVGNPDVGRVRYKGRLKCILPLPCAESEANMVGEKLGVKPFLGKQATKQAVLEVINSVSLIHFAAHGDAERGEIALAPLRSSNRIPREEDFLLTMSDISKVQLRAKLVVLSCCHSGRGQIRAEGAVGIARAFLGSGARSVLVALWALEDSATEQFMSRFYEHLVGGDSASESLHEAMKWMRCNGYSEVRQWAPFMLIGDNVTFDFGKQSDNVIECVNTYKILGVIMDKDLKWNCHIDYITKKAYDLTSAASNKVLVVNCRCYFCILSTRHKGSGVLNMNNMKEILPTISISLIVADFLINTGRVPKAIELCKECLFILDNTPLIKEKKKFILLCMEIYWKVLLAYGSIDDYTNVIKYAKKILPILRERGDRFEEFTVSQLLAISYLRQSKYVEAEEHSEKALLISTEIDDKYGEADCYENLGTVYQSVGEYEKAKEHHMKALAIRKEIGDRNGEASCYGKLGKVFQFVGEYEKAKEYHERALAMKKETGDRDGEATEYANLGTIFQSVDEYKKAKEYHMRALAMEKEIGGRDGEATEHGNLGNVFKAVGEYRKAKEYYEKALMIKKEMRDRNGEACCYGNLGNVLKSLGEYEKAKEYLEVALAIKKEIGDRKGEAASYGNLGNVFQSVGEYVKAKEYYEKAVVITRETNDRKGEGALCGNLGAVFLSLGKYAKANEYLQKALALNKEIGDKKVEADVYRKLGILFQSIGDYKKSREYLEKSLMISKEIGDRNLEASVYGNLGNLFELLGEYVEAEKHHKRALAICEETGDVKRQFTFLFNLGLVMLKAGKIQEALSYLLPSIQKCEDLRDFLRDNDQFKISFSHEHADPYLLLTAFFCSTGNPNKAVYVSELRRARALADLMSAQYSVENQISADPQSWAGIESVMDKEVSSTCLYFSYFDHDMCAWILKARKLVQFKIVNGKEMIVQEGLLVNLDEFFTNERFRSFGVLPEEQCEDRSLNDIQRKPCEGDIREASRIRDAVKDNQDSPKRNLSLCHKLIIAPVADLLEGPEIIIVPERSLYNIPFAALPDESGKYLSETFRIRVVPSLTTLKLIQDSPADYHNETGALIVGNPDVGRVRYKGRRKYISRLPCAESEANMIGEKLGVKPFLGQQATKQAVLQVINSVSLIHFAAHGNAERGEIALAPLRSSNGIPREEDFLLTMSDISKVQLRAKLVVLSCCHSGRGQIRAEGVVGIARAFLGSGARSVLVALWALEDSATEQFMNRFYEHLVGGDSASESLHEAMKWMRCNGYSEVRQWAPFMLIGDNVTFDFGKTK
ncbi:uncharacterized protein LOC144637598 [Oculina patagonica]